MSRETCRAFALERSWENSARQFIGNLAVLQTGHSPRPTPIIAGSAVPYAAESTQHKITGENHRYGRDHEARRHKAVGFRPRDRSSRPMIAGRRFTISCSAACSPRAAMRRSRPPTRSADACSRSASAPAFRCRSTRRNVRIFGTDISEAMLKKAEQRVAESRLKNVEGLAVMDAEKLEFPDNSFDVVMAQYVVTAVPNPEAALDEFARVLRPGGELIILTRVSADAGMRRFIEQKLQPVVTPARLPHRRVRLVALHQMARGREGHGAGRAPADSAARPLLAGPLP